MKESIELSKTFNSKASEIYSAWLDSKKHTEMTGGEATCSTEVGAAFSAWDGYIEGSNKSLVPNKEIIQNWRTSEFKDTDEDSELIIRLKDIDGTCELTLIHTNIPEGESQYEQGWIEHYFEPMSKYFNQ